MKEAGTILTGWWWQCGPMLSVVVASTRGWHGHTLPRQCGHWRWSGLGMVTYYFIMLNTNCPIIAQYTNHCCIPAEFSVIHYHTKNILGANLSPIILFKSCMGTLPIPTFELDLLRLRSCNIFYVILINHFKEVESFWMSYWIPIKWFVIMCTKDRSSDNCILTSHIIFDVKGNDVAWLV